MATPDNGSELVTHLTDKDYIRYARHELALFEKAAIALKGNLNIFDLTHATTDHELDAALLCHRAAARFLPPARKGDVFFGEDSINLLSSEMYTTAQMYRLRGYPFPIAGNIGLIGSGTAIPEVIGLSRQIQVRDPSLFQFALSNIAQAYRDAHPAYLFDENFFRTTDEVSQTVGLTATTNRRLNFFAFDPGQSQQTVGELRRKFAPGQRVEFKRETLNWFLNSQKSGFSGLVWNRADPAVLFNGESFGRKTTGILSVKNPTPALFGAIFSEELITVDRLVTNLMRKLLPGGACYITVGLGNLIDSDVEYDMRRIFTSLLVGAGQSSQYCSVAEMFPITKNNEIRNLMPQASTWCAYLQKPSRPPRK
ncbi:MAG: hypothetical protein NUV65_02110 [Candidatus Roizmanbacteria bacterium]|nr:hypothetical protein [Candidatus Roizmanbacteria bacterium]